MADTELLAAAASVVGEIIKKKIEEKNRNKKVWVRPWIKRRKQLGASQTLIRELAAEDPRSFTSFLGMNETMFHTLLYKVSSRIQKNYTVMRDPLSAQLKLQIACRYLKTGESLGSLQYLYRVPKCSISQFLPDVFEAIYQEMKEFIEVPKTETDWGRIKRGFQNAWNFPNCIGAIDGKNVLIQCPSNSGSQYFNYKGTFSIVLLALVDHDYNFTYIDIGSYGSSSDGGVFGKSSLQKAIDENQINIPNDCVILGDEAFPLKPYLMKPFPRRCALTMRQKVFNYRLCRARHIVENAFGIMASRFRVFRGPITLAPQTVIKVVKAACALHNWLRKQGDRTLSVDIEDHERGIIILGSWRIGPTSGGLNDLTPSLHRNYLEEARERRERLADYFMEEREVHWQYRMIE